MAEGGKHRRGQLHDDRDGGEQNQPHDQRRADAQPAGAHLLLLRQLVGQDRDEDQIVDAEHHLQHDQVSSATQAVGSVTKAKCGARNSTIGSACPHDIEGPAQVWSVPASVNDQRQKAGTVSSSRGPSRSGAIFSARPVLSEISTADAADRRRTRGGLEAALRHLRQESVERLLLVHAERGIVVAAHAGVGDVSRCRRSGSDGRRSADGCGFRRPGWRGRRRNGAKHIFSRSPRRGNRSPPHPPARRAGRPPARARPPGTDRRAPDA